MTRRLSDDEVGQTLCNEDGIDYKRTTIRRNLSVAQLYEDALKYEKGTFMSSTGALITSSGAKTGRSPKDKRIVEDADSVDDIWWGPVNVKMSERVFRINHERAVDYLNTRERLYVFDGFAGWDPANRIKADAWLINTGWNGGKYGEGKRISLKYSRAIIDAIHSGELANAEYETYPVFGLQIPKQITGVPSEVLNPRTAWAAGEASYSETLNKLAALFNENFALYADKATAEIVAAGPKL
ncbi:PEP carboxykinase N-terminal domain-containing protein [Ramicandelaber brevisporus]|nr:PEP carboxykinase N-terminal domain-containing protein [Ramicandelaber brevisporus]